MYPSSGTYQLGFWVSVFSFLSFALVVLVAVWLLLMHPLATTPIISIASIRMNPIDSKLFLICSSPFIIYSVVFIYFNNVIVLLMLDVMF